MDTNRSFSNPPSNVKRKSSYNKLQNFYALNISLPGVPVIYYGEEIGMMGAGDPDNRRMMRFGDDLDLNEIMHKNVISNLAVHIQPYLWEMYTLCWLMAPCWLC